MEVEMALLLECQEEQCAVVYTNCQWPDHDVNAPYGHFNRDCH